MACLYKRGERFWIAYYLDGKLVQRSLRTTNTRVARDKKRKIEYELAIGDLHAASKLPLSAVLEAFCSHLRTIRTHKSYKNDVSRLRVFFGPISELLKPGVPGDKNGKRHLKAVADKYAGAHVKARLLEDVTPEVINRFIAGRLKQDGWSAKTANSMRQTLHRLDGLEEAHEPAVVLPDVLELLFMEVVHEIGDQMFVNLAGVPDNAGHLLDGHVVRGLATIDQQHASLVGHVRGTPLARHAVPGPDLAVRDHDILLLFATGDLVGHPPCVGRDVRHWLLLPPRWNPKDMALTRWRMPRTLVVAVRGSSLPHRCIAR